MMGEILEVVLLLAKVLLGSAKYGYTSGGGRTRAGEGLISGTKGRIRKFARGTSPTSCL